MSTIACQVRPGASFKPQSLALACLVGLGVLLHYTSPVRADCGSGSKCVEGIYGYEQAFTDGFCQKYDQCGRPTGRTQYPGCLCQPTSYVKSVNHYFTQSTDGYNSVTAYNPYQLFYDTFTFRNGAQIHTFNLDTDNSPDVEAVVNFGLERDAIVAWIDVMRDLGRQTLPWWASRSKGGTTDEAEPIIQGPSVTVTFTFQVESDGTYDIEFSDQTCLNGTPATEDNVPECTSRSAGSFVLERVGYQVEKVVPIEGKVDPNSYTPANYLYGTFRGTARGSVELRTGEKYRMELRMWPQGVTGDKPVSFSLKPRNA